MKGSEKMLIVIVAAVIILVVAAFGFVLLRPEPEYGSEDTPDGVVHNYLLALERSDYERAYNYLAKDLKVGDLNDFIDSVEGNPWRFDLGSDVALAIEESKLFSDSTARVEVRKTKSYNEILGSSQYNSTFDVILSNEEGIWLIIDGDSYFDNCWDRDARCP